MAPPPTNTALRIIIWTFVVLSAVTWITMSRVREAMTPEHIVNLSATPLGYTFSLSLVVIPFLVLLYWYLTYSTNHINQWRCFLRTVLTLFVVWLLLDFLFAGTIFIFPNCGAVLGIWFYGILPGVGLAPNVFPIEEFVFYLFACLLILMIYFYSSEVWFPDGSLTPANHFAEGLHAIPIANINWTAVIVGIVLIVLAWIYQQFVRGLVGYVSPLPPAIPPECPVATPTGFTGDPVFPVYFTLLVLIVVVPAVFLFNRIKVFVNTGALHFTMLIVILISIIWEATLALPYGWWGYQPDYMVGISVPAWFDLPFESVILWVASSWSLIFIYELVRLRCITNLSLFQMLIGPLPDKPGVQPPPGTAPEDPTQPGSAQ